MPTSRRNFLKGLTQAISAAVAAPFLPPVAKEVEIVDPAVAPVQALPTAAVPGYMQERAMMTGTLLMMPAHNFEMGRQPRRLNIQGDGPVISSILFDE